MVPLERCLDGVSSVQWFLSFDREMFGEVVVNGSSRFSYDNSRMSTRVLCHDGSLSRYTRVQI
ncbi:hypothetical protein Scep_001902 [Stephania cephalantha]|uniref:Uncharacterized protein n=1 Tax=Stephania cephalantha TaxID=152367 RepID=A0AAP0L9B6_9MAGN